MSSGTFTGANVILFPIPCFGPPFRRFTAELRQLYFTEDGANLPAIAHRDGMLPIHPDPGGLDAASAGCQAIQVIRSHLIVHYCSFNRASFRAVSRSSGPTSTGASSSGLAILWATARRTARSAARVHKP